MRGQHHCHPNTTLSHMEYTRREQMLAQGWPGCRRWLGLTWSEAWLWQTKYTSYFYLSMTSYSYSSLLGKISIGPLSACWKIILRSWKMEIQACWSFYLTQSNGRWWRHQNHPSFIQHVSVKVTELMTESQCVIQYILYML